jgi:hypothetical protein
MTIYVILPIEEKDSDVMRTKLEARLRDVLIRCVGADSNSSVSSLASSMAISKGFHVVGVANSFIIADQRADLHFNSLASDANLFMHGNSKMILARPSINDDETLVDRIVAAFPKEARI